jgi:stage III sporulation protein AH
MKILKNNQIIIYVIALMLVTAGYLNYTSQNNILVETSSDAGIIDTNEIAEIGDATLVSSNDVTEENNEDEMNSNNTDDNEIVEETSSNVSDEDEYFAKSKLERDTMYSQMLESYQNILNNSNSSETQKGAATQEISKINETKNSIMICENLITTKGFQNSVIFINGDSISVIVESDELSQEEIAQIQNIISRELKADISNIHITNK